MQGMTPSSPARLWSTESEQQRLVKLFRQAAATDPQHSVTLDSLGKHRSRAFAGLVRRKVILHGENGEYFLNEEAATRFLRQLRLRYFVILSILLLICLALMCLKYVT